MRKSILLLASIFAMGSLQAQQSTNTIEEGSVLTLGASTASGYKHIKFPRNNFIIKRGAIADFSNLEGKKVVVKKVQYFNGIAQVVIERKDGQNFFRFYPSVTANLDKALANGELIPQPSEKEDYIAHQ